MKPLTHRTDVDMGQVSHRLPKQYRQACRGRMHKGQRGIVARRSVFAGFGYARTSIIRVTRASQAIEGRCNAYQAYGLATPRFSYKRESLPPVTNDILKKMRMTHEAEITIRKKHAAVSATPAIAAPAKMHEEKTLSRENAIPQPECRAEMIQAESHEIDQTKATGKLMSMAPESIPTPEISFSGSIAVIGIATTKIGIARTKIIASENAGTPQQSAISCSQDMKPAPQIGAPAISQAPATQSIAIQIITPNEIQMQDAIPQQQYQSREECRQAYSAPDICPGSPAPTIRISGKSDPVQALATSPASALPISEGLMGAPVEKRGTKIPVASAALTKAPRYISSGQRKRVSLKTASAAAGMPL